MADNSQLFTLPIWTLNPGFWLQEFIQLDEKKNSAARWSLKEVVSIKCVFWLILLVDILAAPGMYTVKMCPGILLVPSGECEQL